jgi:polyether ionophore transport system permease protein
LFRLAPRLVISGWVAQVAFLLLVEVGPLFQLDPRVVGVSPCTHVPKLPSGEPTTIPLVLLNAIAVALITIGLAGFRRGDVG